MKVLTIIEAMQLLCKKTKKFGMYISLTSITEKDEGNWAEYIKAAPYLNLDEHYQLLSDESGIILFSTRKAQWKAFCDTRGDEHYRSDLKGNHKYNGSARVYALTCNSKGELENENT